MGSDSPQAVVRHSARQGTPVEQGQLDLMCLFIIVLSVDCDSLLLAVCVVYAHLIRSFLFWGGQLDLIGHDGDASIDHLLEPHRVEVRRADLADQALTC